MNHNSYTGATDWVVGAVKNNPEGLLLLAAGCALLMRSGSGGSKKRLRSHSRSIEGGEPFEGQRRSTEGRMSRAAGSVREYAADIGDTVSETASSYAGAVSDYAADAGRTIADRSGHLAEQAQETLQSTMDSVLEKQPLAVVLAGFAAGAAVAAVFPTTAIERRTLGPAGEQLSDAAARTGRQMQTAASAAGERLKSAADERGLNADGLKEMAKDVAGDVADAFDEALAEGSRNLSSSRSSGSMSATKSEPAGAGGASKAKTAPKST